MKMSPPPLYNLIGKPIRERYGRFEGTVVSVETTPNGDKAIVYENGGVLVRSDSSSFRFDGSKVEVAHPVIYTAEKLYEDLSFLLVQQRSIANLRGRGVFSQGVFNELRGELDSRRESLFEASEEIVKKLGKRLTRVDEKRDWVYRLIMNLEVTKKMELLKDEEHASSNERLREELSRVLSEAEEIKRFKTDISSIMASIKETQEETLGTSPIVQSASPEEIFTNTTSKAVDV